MYKYASVKDGKVIALHRQLYGGFRFPDGTSTGSVQLMTDKELATKGVYPVEETRPDIAPYFENYVTSEPGNAQFNATTKKVELTHLKVAKDENTAMATIRAERNARLARTDKFMLLDYPITDAKRKQVQDYRAALRAVEGLVDVNSKTVNWPDEPTGL